MTLRRIAISCKKNGAYDQAHFYQYAKEIELHSVLHLPFISVRAHVKLWVFALLALMATLTTVFFYQSLNKMVKTQIDLAEENQSGLSEEENRDEISEDDSTVYYSFGQLSSNQLSAREFQIVPFSDSPSFQHITTPPPDFS